MSILRIAAQEYTVLSLGEWVTEAEGPSLAKESTNWVPPIFLFVCLFLIVFMVNVQEY